MPDRKTLTAADEDILLEAARWLERARAGLSATEKLAFRAWLDERREHAAAADAVASAWAAAPEAARQAGLAAPSRAVRARPPRPVRENPGRENPGRENRVADWSLVSWLIPGPKLAMAYALLPLALFGSWWLVNLQQLDYATGPAQRIAVSLPDGSRVWLAPRSRLSARFDPFGRHVWLHGGEATLQVAHRSDTFEVDVGDVKVLDRGTLFDVRKRDKDMVSVVLVEGRIEVQDRVSGKTLAMPSPGERVSVRNGIAAIAGTDARTAIAWRDGRLVFKDCSLAVALAGFAEQGAPPVALGNAALGRIRISGAFATNGIESFLSALAEIHPVTWRRTDKGYEIRPR